MDLLRSRYRAFAAIAAGFGLSFASGAGEGAAAPGLERARFHYEEGRIYVPVSVKGRPLGDFILDTGASHVLVDSARSGAARLVIRGRGEARGAGASASDMSYADGATFEVAGADLTTSGTEIAAIDRTLLPYTGHPIGGIIGAPFFYRYVVTIDFASSVLELADPGRFAYRGAGIRLPLNLAGDVPVIEGALIMRDGASLPLRLLVDLGAKANLLIAGPFDEAHGVARRLGARIVEPLGAGVGGKTRYAFARLPGLRLAGGKVATPANILVGVSVGGTLRGGYYDALLGAPFLSKYRVTIDYRRRELILEPKQLGRPDGFDRSGAFLTAPPENPLKFMIDEVVPESPAAEAGLKSGDALVSIDGKPVRAWSLAGARKRLASAGSARVILEIERGDERLHVTIHLRKLV